MKKLLTTLLLSVWSLIALSQSDTRAFSLTIGIRDNIYQEFTWGETQILQETIPIKFNGKDITIYTEDIQYYQTLMPEYKTNGGSYWFAYDVNMKKCKFYMVESKGTNFVMVEYDDVCIIYGVVYE
jgi:hypothetical protein